MSVIRPATTVRIPLMPTAQRISLTMAVSSMLPVTERFGNPILPARGGIRS